MPKPPSSPTAGAKPPASAAPDAAVDQADPAPARFPIIGLGASAGGFEALERFLRHVPARSGAAYVIVQHLDPAHRSPLAELLQRDSALPVREISDGMAVEPDHIYVIPPDRLLTLAHGTLCLGEVRDARARQTPIDHFLTSLANEHQQHAIGVILSGSGTDGTLGLMAIKELGGLTAAQDPASASVEDMPRSAIEAGVTDVIASADKLPGRILAIVRKHAHSPRFDLAENDRGGSRLAQILHLLQSQTGHDFSLYKKTTLYRRIERRMSLRRIAALDDYIAFMQQHPNESTLLFRELLICVTRFFRDEEVWEQLRTVILPGLIATRPAGGVLRAWCPGCATGEEAYSLAMVFHEALDQIQTDAEFSLQIFATDLNGAAIDKARRGLYPASIATAVSGERLRRFFVEETRGWRVRQEIREMVIFAPHSLLSDPPFTKLDLLSCRNLMIYLSPDVHETLIPRFHFSLSPGGILLLGSSESVGSATNLFTPLSGCGQLYQRLNAPLQPTQMGVTLGANSLTPLAPLLRSSLPMTANANLQALADQLLLQRYTPAAVMVTSTGDIVHISGKTGRYLEPATGKANWNVLAMAREGLSAAMSEAFYDAQRQHATVTLTAVQTGDDGVARSVEITVQPLSEPLALRGMLMIVFADVTTPAPPQLLGKAERTARQSARLKAMEQALQATREELQVTREEMQTSREELTSTNEELQSTNEELTTSAEELRTMNEELVRARSAAEHSLARYTDLFDSAPVGYVTIDRNSVITQANLLAAELLGLNRDQRVGGHLALFVVEADRPAFASCIERGFTSREAQLCEVALWRGSGPPRKVRVSALAADDGRACRVVVIDISEIREAEAALRESEERFRTLADHAPALIWMAGPDKLCTHFNQAWRDFTGRTIEQELGNGWAEVVHPDDLAQCWGIYSGSFDERKAFSMEYRLRRHDGEYRWLLDHGIPRFAANGTFLGYIGSCIDITERKQVDLEKDHERVVLEVLAQGGSLPELLARLVLSFETLLPGMRGSVLLLDADGRRLRHGAAPNLPPAYCQALDGAEIGANAGSCGTAAHSGRNVIVADIANDPLWNDYRDLALSHGLRACWSVPIFGRARRVLGTFAFYFTVPRAAHQSELATIDRGAHLASLAIERHLAETALAATTAMLERTGALARIGGWQLDLRDMKLLWSLEVFRIHELEPTTTPGIDTALGFYPPEAQPIARGMVRDAIDHGAPWDRELPLVTAKGRQRWVRTQGTAVMEGGKAIMLHGTIQDITERKLLEDELRQAQKMEAVGRLAGGIAHDFNNQLTVIQGYGSMALARTSDEAVAKCLTQIVNASDRSAKLVQQLLTFSRKGRHTVAQVDVHVLLSELLEVLGRSLSKLIRLRPALTARDPRIMGDAGLLQNALLNLALNSRDAMPSGGDLGFGTSLVEVDEEHAARLGGEIAPGPHLVITVSDSGLGMSEEVQRHLFEPFFSTKALGQGTGLGLASVYGTIKHHRGAIEVESAEGRGTTFRIYLPRAGQAPEPQPEQDAARPLPLPADESTRVLVIDDEAFVAAYVSDTLAGLGYEVESRLDGAAALDLYRAQWRGIALIVLDMNMPVMSGPQTFAGIRAINPAAKVFIISGHSEEGGVEELMRQGAVGFLAKPFRPEVLAQRIAQVLEQKPGA